MARELNYRITGDARDFNRTLKSIDGRLGESERRAQKFSSAIKGAIGVGAVSTLGLFGKKAIEAASDIDESLTKNQQIFGKHAKGIEAWSQTTADRIGISRAEALEATGTFGNLFSALQIGERPAATMSRSLVKLAADLASFNNADPKDVLESLRSGLSGESEPMRKFGAFLSEGRVKTEAYAKGIAKTGSELTEQQKVQARYSLILKDTTKAHGDFARTSGGLANQQRKLRASYEDAKAALGEKLLPVVSDGITALNKFIGQMKSGKGAGGDFADAMRRLANVGKDVATFLKEHPALIKIAIGAWAAYKTASLIALGAIKVQNFRKVFMRSVPAAATAGTAAGTAMAASTTTAASAGMIKGKGKFRGAALAIGKFMGPLIAIPLAVELAQAIERKFNPKGTTITSVTQDVVDRVIDKATGGGKNIPAIKAPRGGVPRGVTSTVRANTSAHGGRVRARASSAPSTSNHRSHGVRARASATVSGDDLSPELRRRLQAMADGTGHAIHVQSGLRTLGEQQALVEQKGLYGPNNPTGAAAPSSNAPHVRGVAADITPGREVFGGVAGQYGLAFPLPAEPWHVELAGGSAPSAAAGTSRGRAQTVTPRRRGPTPAQRAARSADTAQKAGAVRGRNRAAARARKSLERRRAWPLEHLEEAQALAGLTEDTGDDLIVLKQMEELGIERLKRAQKAGNSAGITKWAQFLSGVRGDIKGLTDTGESGEDPNQPLIDALAESAAAAQAQADALESLNTEVKRGNDLTERLAGSEFGALKAALADVVSGQIGGRVLRGLGTPAFASGGMAY